MQLNESVLVHLVCTYRKMIFSVTDSSFSLLFFFTVSFLLWQLFQFGLGEFQALALHMLMGRVRQQLMEGDDVSRNLAFQKIYVIKKMLTYWILRHERVIRMCGENWDYKPEFFKVLIFNNLKFYQFKINNCLERTFLNMLRANSFVICDTITLILSTHSTKSSSVYKWFIGL